jgi:RND family efflux transporter MFP subunit
MTRIIAIAFILVTFLTGCQRFRATSPAASSSEAPTAPSIKLVRPEKKTVTRLIEQPAQNVEGFQQAPLYAKIAGYVHKLNVDIGDRVTTNQILVELSVPELDVELKQKEAMLAQADAEVQLAIKSLSAARSSVKSAAALVKQAESGRTRAKAEQQRVRSQHDRLMKVGSGVVNPETLSESQFALDAAKAQVDEVEAKVLSAQAAHDESQARCEKAEADVEVMKARRDVARASRDQVQTMIEYTRIRAPFDGIVTKRCTDIRHFVQPTSASAKGEPLVVVERSDKFRVWVLVPELEALWVNRELSGARPPAASIHGEGLSGRVLQGKLARSSFALDLKTRTLRTEIDLDNREGLLSPGMYVHARIKLERPNVWALPLSAVRKSEGTVSCFRVESGKVRTIRLLVGLEGNGLIEVRKKQSASGEGWEDLTGQEEIVASPPATMADGQVIGAVEKK